MTTTQKYQYVTDDSGRPTGVIVTLDEFTKMKECVAMVDTFNAYQQALLSGHKTIDEQIRSLENYQDRLDLIIKVLGIPSDDLSAEETLYRTIARRINKSRPLIDKDIQNIIIAEEVGKYHRQEKPAEVVHTESAMEEKESAVLSPDEVTRIVDEIMCPLEEAVSENDTVPETPPTTEPENNEVAVLKKKPETSVEKIDPVPAAKPSEQVVCEEPVDITPDSVQKKGLVQLLNNRLSKEISYRKMMRINANVSINMAATHVKMSCDQLIAFEEDPSVIVDQTVIRKLATLYDCSFANLREPEMVVARKLIKAFSSAMKRAKEFAESNKVTVTRAWRLMLRLRDKIDFARKIGVSTTTIDHIESGDPVRIASCSIWAIYRFAKECGCNIDQLFDGIDFPKDEKPVQKADSSEILDPVIPKQIVQKELDVYIADEAVAQAVKEIASAYKVSLLCAWRHHHGYSVKDTAATVEISPGELIINEKKGVAPIRVLFDLSILYGCSIEQLIGKENYSKTDLTINQLASNALWHGSTKRTLMRYAAKLTREQVVSKITPLKMGSFVAFEQNKRDLPDDIIQRLATLYGCRADELNFPSSTDTIKKPEEPVKEITEVSEYETVKKLSRYVKPKGLSDHGMIITWREFRKMSINDAAKKSGIPVKTLKKLESGQLPSYPRSVIESLAKAYRCRTTADLFYRQDTEEVPEKLLGYHGYTSDDLRAVAKIKMDHGLTSDLCAWRKHRGVSHHDLADLLKIPDKNYLRAERGTLKLRSGDEYLICHYLQCPDEVFKMK